MDYLGFIRQRCKSVVSMIKQFGDDIQYLGPDEFGKLWREEFEHQKELGKLLKK